MQARRLTLAALTSGVFFLGAQAAPITMKYRIEQKTEQEADLTVLGQSKQTNRSGQTMFVTLTLTDSASGRSAHLVIDSARADTGALAGTVQPMLDSLKGQAFHAFIANGKVGDVKALREGSTSTGAVAPMFSTLTPRVKMGTKVGAAWTDTTDATNDIPGGSVKTRTVTNYKASALETRDGIKALKVEGAASSALNGSQQGMAIEGTGNGASTMFVAPDGHLVAATATSNATLAVTVPQAAEPIPITVKTTMTVSAIK